MSQLLYVVLLAPFALSQEGAHVANKVRRVEEEVSTRYVSRAGADCSNFDRRGYRHRSFVDVLIERPQEYMYDCDQAHENDRKRGLQSEESTCRNGLPGVASSGGRFCCPTSCGQCGGVGCGRSAEGETCCTGGIDAMCSDSGEAPCIVDDDVPASSVEPSTPAGLPCSNGFPGVASSGGNFCCPAACERCGGSGCARFAEGVACCTGSISAMCSDVGEAPCIVDDSTEETTSTCSNGLPGIGTSSGEFCCPAACGQCGGSGCRDFAEGVVCCTSSITDLCSTSGQAPCRVESDDIANPAPVSSSDGSTPTEYTASTPVASPDYPMPVPAPSPVMETPSSCTKGLPGIRWASGTSLAGRLYLEGEGCATMTDLYKARVESDGKTSKGPLYVLDNNDDVVLSPEDITGKWLLTADLYVRETAVLYCKGSGAGGDCDELRIQSTGSNDFHEIRGHGGSLYFDSTLVTSWDTPNKEPQEKYTGGRSYINCVSEKAPNVGCEGQAQMERGECRMDILNSEMGYLGWFDSESYGLTWKVRGFCKDKSNPEVFETTNVYGDIINSDIHHMYYGMYSYGHQGGVWTDNLMHDNHQYGFDPHDDSDYLTIARNTVYDNENHGIIASKRCNNVLIYDNEVHSGGPEAVGIFLHRSSDSCKVYNNNVHDMQDAGIAILESFDAEVYNNNFTNVRFGIRVSLGGGNNYVHENVFDTCSSYGIYTYMGSDEPEQTPDGRPGENRFIDNKILNSVGGVRLKEADNTVISGNEFTGTEKMQFFDARTTTWKDNSVPNSACAELVTEDEGSTIPDSTFTEETDSSVPTVCH